MGALSSAWSLARQNLRRKETALSRLEAIGYDGKRTKSPARTLGRPKSSKKGGLTGGETGPVAETPIGQGDSTEKAE